MAAKKLVSRLSQPIKKIIKKISKKKAPEPGPKVHKVHHIGADEWSSNGQWVGVASSNVFGIKYDLQKSLLFVQFKDQYSRAGGSVYVYYNVAPMVAKSMFEASSMGKFVWYKLRGRYSYARLS